MISVILCTYNPRRDYLERVLRALGRQSLSQTDWELLIIDNNSQPPLTLAPEAGLPAWTLLREPRPGLTYARTCGILAARGETLIFIDDDNELDSSYLHAAATFLTGHPEVGVVGGRIIPEFERAPETWLTPYLGMLALRDFGDKPVISDWRNTPGTVYPWFAPFGAGMVVRTRYARAYLDRIAQMPEASVGRQGASLGGCEDAEIVLCGVLQQGAEAAFCPAMKLTHLIPSRRVSPEYFAKLLYESAVTWGQFKVRHGLARPISRATLPLRLARAALRQRVWTRTGYLNWRQAAGEFIGRANARPLST